MDILDQYFDKGYKLGYADAVDAITTYIKAQEGSVEPEKLLEFLESISKMNAE